MEKKKGLPKATFTAFLLLTFSIFFSNFLFRSEPVQAQMDSDQCYGGINVSFANSRTGQSVALDQYYNDFTWPYQESGTMNVQVGDVINVNAFVVHAGEASCNMTSAFLNGGSGIFDSTGNSNVNLMPFGGINDTYIVGSGDSGIYGESDAFCGNGCLENFGMINLSFNIVSSTTYTITCTPPSNTITAGSSTSFNLSTTGSGGFSSPVTFSHSISPSSGVLPSISYVNNGQAPNSTTTANITTTASTTPANYTITFTANGGSVSRTCDVQLVVSGTPSGSFLLTINPASAEVLKGGGTAYTVGAQCFGGVTGPITGLTMVTTYTGVSYSFTSGKSTVTSVPCGGSVTLHVTTIGSTPIGELSSPQQVVPRNLTVSGQVN